MDYTRRSNSSKSTEPKTARRIELQIRACRLALKFSPCKIGPATGAELRRQICVVGRRHVVV